MAWTTFPRVKQSFILVCATCMDQLIGLGSVEAKMIAGVDEAYALLPFTKRWNWLLLHVDLIEH